MSTDSQETNTNDVNEDNKQLQDSATSVASTKTKAKSHVRFKQWFKQRHVMITTVITTVVLTLAIGSYFALWLPFLDSSESRAEPVAASLGAALTLIDGVVWLSDDKQTWREAEGGESLSEGQYVRTGKDSRAIIALDDGSASRLNSDTTARLRTLRVDNVQIENSSGEIYARVVTLANRQFSVRTNEANFTAHGTAYRTISGEDKDGVEVYHGSVKTGRQEDLIEEGKQYFAVNKNEDLVEKITDLSSDELADDEFIKWNMEQDKENDEFKDKLGFLESLEKKPSRETPAVNPNPASPAGISLQGDKSDKGIYLKWSASGVNTADGFKIVYSTAGTPTFGTHASAHIGSSTATTFLLELKDGQTYNIRVCAYRPAQGGCDSYSNTVQIAAAFIKEEPKEVISGPVSLSLAGKKLSWNFEGTAPHGFKVVMSTSSNPTYPSNSVAHTSSTAHTFSTKNMDSGTYYFRVCKWTVSSCTDYSNQVTYTHTE